MHFFLLLIRTLIEPLTIETKHRTHVKFTHLTVPHFSQYCHAISHKIRQSSIFTILTVSRRNRSHIPFSYRNMKTLFIDIVYFSISFLIVVNNNGVQTALTNNPVKGVLQCFSKTAMNISNMRTLAETLDATRLVFQTPTFSYSR